MRPFKREAVFRRDGSEPNSDRDWGSRGVASAPTEGREGHTKKSVQERIEKLGGIESPHGSTKKKSRRWRHLIGKEKAIFQPWIGKTETGPRMHPFLSPIGADGRPSFQKDPGF